MTDREQRKLSRRQLQELCLRQEKSCEAANRQLEDLEQENKTLRDSLTRIGKTMRDMRAREEAAEAALAEKDEALRDMEQKLAAAEAAQTDDTKAAAAIRQRRLRPGEQNALETSAAR